MGCDIHLFTEIKVNGVWHCHSVCNVRIDYGLFAKMANVRNYKGVEPISEPKGLPKDLSVTVQKYVDYWGSDAHSKSWFNSEEINEFYKFVENQIEQIRKKYPDSLYDIVEKRCGYLFGSSWENFNPEADEYGVEDVRFVFWFDN